MVADLGFGVLFLMLFVYAVAIPFGVICAIVFLTRKRYGDCGRTLLYLLTLSATTAMASLPFLNMHGSLSDWDWGPPQGKLWMIMLLQLRPVSLIPHQFLGPTRLNAMSQNKVSTPVAGCCRRQ